MAQGLMNLSNLLGQSSDATQGGLMGGGVFSQPMSRGQRRSKLLTDAISGAGQNPYARLGASFGGLIGMGGRAAAEGLGIVDEPEEVKRNKAIRQVQEEVREQGLDPMENPAQFGEVVSKRFQELGFNDLALKTQLQVKQMMPEQTGTTRVVRGGTEAGSGIGLSEGESAVVEFGPNGQVAGIKDRTQTDPDEEKGSAVNVRMPDGSFQRGVEREDGTVVNQQGERFPAEATLVGMNLTAAKDSDLPQNDIDILNQQEIGVKNYFDLANEAIDVYNENPNANTLAAEGTRILSGVKSEFDAFLDVTGVELKEGTTKSKLLEVSNYESQFEELGLENAGLKSLYLSLALSQAQAEAEQTGRALSDKDVERFLKQQGAQYGKPEFATEILRRNARRLRNSFVNSYETRTGKDFDGEFDKLREFNPPEPQGEGSQQMNFSEMSTKELGNVNLDELSDEQIDQFLKATEPVGE